jgi:small-conductance mechanosensitive channel
MHAVVAVSSLADLLVPWLGTVVALVIVIAVMVVANRLLYPRTTRRFRGPGPQVTMLVLGFLGAMIVLIATPLESTTRGQLLSFFGIVFSAAIALSSTTLLGNALAGAMLRSVKNFRTGDFVQVGDVFGRVSERGLVHTEVQTADRDLVTLPHLYLVTHPVKVVRSSGTIVSATVSLGYDIPHTRIEALLLQAARETELEEPFVQIIDLQDHAVVYRVAGLLRDVVQLISKRSRLRAKMLDCLHEGGIEIVSPGFTNMRHYDGRAFVPPKVVSPAVAETESRPEEVVFDKADEAATLESLRERVSGAREELRGAREREKKGSEEERAALTAAAEALETRLTRLESLTQAREDKVHDR